MYVNIVILLLFFQLLDSITLDHPPRDIKIFFVPVYLIFLIFYEFFF